jgi:hypothetical protein
MRLYAITEAVQDRSKPYFVMIKANVHDLYGGARHGSKPTALYAGTKTSISNITRFGIL